MKLGTLTSWNPLGHSRPVTGLLYLYLLQLLTRVKKSDLNFGGPDSAAGIATGYGLDGPGIESRWG